MNNVKRPLYFDPSAKPQDPAANVKYLSLKPSEHHFKKKIRQNQEKKTNPRSTYAVIESLTITGVDKKNKTPSKPKSLPAYFFK
jgi:hypothetical protein